MFSRFLFLILQAWKAACCHWKIVDYWFMTFSICLRQLLIVADCNSNVTAFSVFKKGIFMAIIIIAFSPFSILRYVVLWLTCVLQRNIPALNLERFYNIYNSVINIVHLLLYNDHLYCLFSFTRKLKIQLFVFSTNAQIYL